MWHGRLARGTAFTGETPVPLITTGMVSHPTALRQYQNDENGFFSPIMADERNRIVISSETLRSYALCERISKREAKNFYLAFRILPRDQRRAMCALYAFLRLTDDLADEPGPIADKTNDLLGWRQSLQKALQGKYDHPIFPALHHSVDKFAIPGNYLFAAIDGVEMDLHPVHYQTFDELYNYCYHVASVVGLCCIHIWGFANENALHYAEKAGIAFQLTNILRDLSEDAGRGRVYLPKEEFDRFRCGDADLLQGQCPDSFRDFMQFQVGRARQYYEEAMPLLPLLDTNGRAVFLTLAQTYRSLLDSMEKRNYDVFSSRVSLSKWHKIFLALRYMPVRWGWSTYTRVS